MNVTAKRITTAGFFLAIALAGGTASPALAQPGSEALMDTQREAMTRFAAMDGIWRGPAWQLGPGGEKIELTQTERVGSFLDGTVKVVEGRGYVSDGSVAFNALGVISYDPQAKGFRMNSWAQGRSGDFALTLTADGYQWEIPAGPMTIRYTATIGNGKWKEVGDRVMRGRDPVRFFEMTLERVGATDWPTEGAVPAR